MPQRVATIESLAMVFAGVKAVQAGGLEWSDGPHPLGRHRARRRRRLGDRPPQGRRLPAQRPRRSARLLALPTSFPSATFRDRTSMDRILFALFIHDNKSEGADNPFSLVHNSQVTPMPDALGNTGYL